MYTFHFILVLNLFHVIFGNTGRASIAQKSPLKIIGSDEEVLQPLHEKDDNSKFEKSFMKMYTSINNEFSFSSPSKIRSNSVSFSSSSFGSMKGVRQSKPQVESESFHYKMNLDLPSIKANNLKLQNKPSEFTLSASPNNLKAALNETPQNTNFNNPFENDKDIDIVLFTRPNSTIRNDSMLLNPQMPVNSGTVIVSLPINQKEPNIAPGTVLTAPNFKPNIVPVSNDAFSLAKFGTPDVKLPQSSSCTQPSKASKIKSLERPGIENMVFDPLYAGPRITIDSSVTTDFVYKILIPYFKAEKLLDRKSSYSLFYRAFEEFDKEESLQEIDLKADEKIVIFGDIHGQFQDFVKIIEKEGPPSDKLKYIFNGDIVDRGAFSIECLITLLALKVAEPDNFYITLGNHETSSVGKLQFYKETIKKYGNDEFFQLAHSLFRSLPVAYLIQNEVFVTHGGISPFVTLDQIRNVDRFEPSIQDEDIISDLVWSDPMNENGSKASHRGLGFLFGPDVTRNFVIQNNISAIIRSHQFKEFGYSEQHDGLCITIFSCPNYRGRAKNYGAYIKLDGQLNLSYNIFKAADSCTSKFEYANLPSDLKLTRNIRRIR